MARITSTRITIRAVPLALLICLAAIALGQNPTTPTKPTGVIKIRVRILEGTKSDGTKIFKGLSRKRFFVIKGKLEQNKGLLESFQQRPLVSRECYYRGIGASDALIAWLKKGDGCESVYCREVQPSDVEGATAVPEFQKAIAEGQKQFGNPDLARKWLAVNLPENILSGFYKQQSKDLNTVLDQARKQPNARVYSTMTDAKGAGYFVDLEPGVYTISNILAAEYGERAMLWNCEVTVRQSDLATEKIYSLSNKANANDKQVRCFAEEKPLPACPATPK
jgi:hypothetical protein